MNEKSQDFDLNRHQKSRLLSLGVGSKSRKPCTDTVEKKEDMLYDILIRTLPIEPLVVESLPSVIKGLSSRLHSLAGQPIGELLKNPATDIDTIRKIKQYAKESGTATDSEDEKDVFLAVYYAAIASALIFHNEKITQHSYNDLEQFFSSFMEKDWIIEEIKGLFRKAWIHCKKTAVRSESSKE